MGGERGDLSRLSLKLFLLEGVDEIDCGEEAVFVFDLSSIGNPVGERRFATLVQTIDINDFSFAGPVDVHAVASTGFSVPGAFRRVSLDPFDRGVQRSVTRRGGRGRSVNGAETAGMIRGPAESYSEVIIRGARGSQCPQFGKG